MTPEQFTALIASITGRIEGRGVDAALNAELDRLFPASGPIFGGVFEACQAAIAAGWMCSREAGEIRYGRVVKPGPATHGYSVDVVAMENVVGPHHVHPNGEIDMVMPLTAGAKFDGHGAGWMLAARQKPCGGTGRLRPCRRSSVSHSSRVEPPM
jgi:hypothetical protein